MAMKGFAYMYCALGSSLHHTYFSLLQAPGANLRSAALKGLRKVQGSHWARGARHVGW